jgi:hypothetical protein
MMKQTVFDKATFWVTIFVPWLLNAHCLYWMVVPAEHALSPSLGPSSARSQDK